MKSSFHNRNIGKIGENIACDYLIKNGYKIICRNYRNRFGEIDIIASFKNEVVFVEVKTRNSLRYGFPVEAVNTQKEKHIINACRLYVLKNHIKNIRFDIIEVYLSSNEYKINQIKNVFF